MTQLFLLPLLTCICLVHLAAIGAANAQPSFGPAYHEFRLTLAPGTRQEALGPFYYGEQQDTTRIWAVPPLMSYTLDRQTDLVEFDFLYPFVSYDRYGPESRWHIFQLLSVAVSRNMPTETNINRYTLFPLLFFQRSPIPEKNYTAVVPFYGRLQNRLWRDEVFFVMMPLYVQSRKRDVVTDNYLYPFFHLRHGEGLRGWQFWPLLGSEHKDVTFRTNNWEEVELIGGHDKWFTLWPIYFNQTTGVGTTNTEKRLGVLPFYTRLRSPMRDSTGYGWPLGYTHTVDRERRYEEWDTPWPLLVFARGPGKTINRVWPFFSRGHTETLEVNWYGWVTYRERHIHSPPLDRFRARVLFFLYSGLRESNTETGEERRRVDLWPFFTYRREIDGNQRLQILAPLEPVLPTSKSIERNYSPLWSLWRSEKNPRTHAASQSLLWNLYRHETSPEAKKTSLLFGLFQYQSNPQSSRWRVLYIPMGKRQGFASP